MIFSSYIKYNNQLNRLITIKKYYFKTLIISLLSLVSKYNYGLDTLFIHNDFQSSSIENFAGVYVDQNTSIEIDRIQQLENKTFLPLREFGLSHPPSENIYWVSCILKNNSEKSIDLVLENNFTTIDYIQFFSQGQNTLIRGNLTGDRVKFSNRSPKHRYFLFNLRLSPGESQQVYYYLNKRGAPILINTQLFERNYYYEKDNFTQFYSLLYIGFLTFMCFLTLIITLIFRQNITIFYAAYCFFGTGLVFNISGFGFQYIWGNYPMVSVYIGYSLTIGMLISFSMLTRHFLKIKEILPRSNRQLFILELLVLFILLPGNLLHLHLPKLWMIYITYFGQFIQIVMIISIIITSILAYQKTKKKSYLVYLFSFTFYIIGILTFIISRFTTWIEVTGWLLHGVYFIWFFDLLILMILIIIRVRQTFIENTQLIQQLTQSQLNAANLLLEGQLEERKRLSRELHDGISIKMALLKMRLNDFFKQKNETTTEIITEVVNISDDIRDFTHAISPLDLEEETLEDAIEDLTYKIENQANIEIKVSLNRFEEQQLKDNYKHNLYQILQELFNNTIKYAEATFIKIQLSTIDNQLELSYQDNGKGFDINSVNTGIGLKNIQARIDLLNGIADIKSDENGSQFTFSFNI